MGQPLLISTAQCAQPVDGPEHLPIYAPDPWRAACSGTSCCRG